MVFEKVLRCQIAPGTVPICRKYTQYANDEYSFLSLGFIYTYISLLKITIIITSIHTPYYIMVYWYRIHNTTRAAAMNPIKALPPCGRVGLY